MDITTALRYMNETHQAEVALLLGNFEENPTPETRGAVEELLFELMQQHPECVYAPVVNQYHSIRVKQIQDGGSLE